jgi:NAD(P)-dependent dehydrogenase (short-subunit alcohol dehydrogenase family)
MAAHPIDRLVWGWSRELLDPSRLARRAERAVRGRSEETMLRAAVARKPVLVTGASSGIGRASALRLGAAGAELLLVARRETELRQVAEQVVAAGGRAHVLACDLSDAGQTDRLAERVLAEHPDVGLLINNAAKSILRPLSAATGGLEDYVRLMELNFLGTLRLTVPLVRRMRERGSGHVINISTIGTQVGPVPHFSAYIASKSALDGFTRCAAAETARDGVLWTTVHMPLARTPMIAPTGQFNTMPALPLADAASMVIDAVVRRPARVSHPVGLTFEAAYRVAPRWVERRWSGVSMRKEAGRERAVT